MNKTFCPMKTMADIFDVQPGNGVLFVDASREYAYLASPEEIDLMAVSAERKKQKVELARLVKMEGYLKELGYGG